MQKFSGLGLVFAFVLTACSEQTTPSSPVQSAAEPVNGMTGDNISSIADLGLGNVEKIRIVGSSTVAPFSTTVAEQFGVKSKFDTPIVEVTGTGGGMKIFCEGIGPETASITNASRPITEREIANCLKNGVTDIVEVLIGYDGIVFANAKPAYGFNLTKAQIFTALAKDLPIEGGGWQPNPNKKWSDISPDFPDDKIQVLGPPPTSGTRDAFLELAMEYGAKQIPELAALSKADKAAFKTRSHTIREDGAWIDSGENDTAMIQALIKNPNALGVLGFSFLDQNRDRVKAASIDGVSATFDNIAQGDYPVARSLFIYVKAQNLGMVPGIEAFIEEFTDEAAWSEDGYLSEKGLIPLNEDQRAEIAAHARAMTLMDIQ